MPRAEVCLQAELLAYTREGSPTWCGEVMGVFVESPRPAADDTLPDHPPIPTGGN